MTESRILSNKQTVSHLNSMFLWILDVDGKCVPNVPMALSYYNACILSSIT